MKFNEAQQVRSRFLQLERPLQMLAFTKTFILQELV